VTRSAVPRFQGESPPDEPPLTAEQAEEFFGSFTEFEKTLIKKPETLTIKGINDAVKVAQDKGLVHTSHGHFSPGQQVPAEAQVATDLDQQILERQEKLIQIREAQLLQLPQMQAQRAAATRK
jgi:hypothetical protein